MRNKNYLATTVQKYTSVTAMSSGPNVFWDLEMPNRDLHAFLQMASK